MSDQQPFGCLIILLLLIFIALLGIKDTVIDIFEYIQECEVENE